MNQLHPDISLDHNVCLVCLQPAVYGGAIMGTSGLACEAHRDDLRDPKPLYTIEQLEIINRIRPEWFGD